MTMVVRWTGQEARALRLARRMSIRAFATHLGISAASIGNWEKRGSDIRLRHETQEILDRDLSGAAAHTRQRFLATLATLTSRRGSDHQVPRSAEESDGPWLDREHGNEQLEELDIGQVFRLVKSVSQEYLHAPPSTVFRKAVHLAESVMRRAQFCDGARSRDFHLAAGYLHAMVGWMAGDCDHLNAARQYNWTAWLCADLAADPTLKAWVLSSMSKTAMWAGEFAQSADLAARGRLYPAIGSVHTMLACQEADALAEGGSAARARQLITAIPCSTGAVSADEVSGLLSCNQTRRINYVTSVLARSGQPEHAARTAMALLDGTDGAHAAQGTLAQLRITAARGYATMGDVELAAHVLGPVLAAPAERRLATVAHRLAQLDRTITTLPSLRAQRSTPALSSAIETYCEGHPAPIAPSTEVPSAAGGVTHEQRPC